MNPAARRLRAALGFLQLCRARRSCGCRGLNLKTAKALNLTIPPSLLARADHVIE